MNLVNRLIMRELMGPLINSVLMFLFLLFATANLFTLTDMLVRGVDPFIVGRMAVLSLPMLVTQTLPMGMLLATLLAFGRLSSDSENIALHAGGISFFRMMQPIVWAGICMTIVAFAWNETVAPPATAEFHRLKREAGESYAQKGNPLRYDVRVPGSDRIDEIVYIHGGYDSATGWFRDITIVKMSDDPKLQGHPEFVVTAERARPNSDDPKGEDWTYQGFRIFDLRPDADPKYLVRNYIKSITSEALRNTVDSNIGMRQTFRGVIQSAKPDNRSMTFRELRDKIRIERAQNSRDADGDEVDLWGKISTPLASLIFGLVGAPLGIRPHRGSKAMGFGVAIGIIFIYWATYNWMYVVGKNGGLPPLVASFAPNILGVIAAIFLMSRTRQ